MPAESKTSITCSSASNQDEYRNFGIGGNGGGGAYRDLTVSGGGGGAYGDLTINDKTTVQYIANPGWVSGTTSIGTVSYPTSYPKDGEIHMNPETLEFSIFLSEYNKWIPCEVEELRKEKDKDGNIKNIVTVSFGCSVAQMKKKQRERIVMFEKFKKVESLFSFLGNTISFQGNFTIGNSGFITYTGTGNPLTITYPTLTYPASTYINTTNIVGDNGIINLY